MSPRGKKINEQMRAEAMSEDLARRGVQSAIPPLAIATIMTVVGQALALEDGIDVTLGHDETRRYIESWLDAIRHGGGAMPD